MILTPSVSLAQTKDWEEHNEEEITYDEKQLEKDEDEKDYLKVEHPSTITREILNEVQRELGLIRLCWPEKDIEEDAYLSTLPDSYCTVSDKEKLLLWYAENFRKQYHIKYKDRRPLLLACENECGVQKFVSTTIRRSTLPYSELYTWQGCAKFLSDYILYEPLEKDLVLPKYLRSPTWLIHFRKGNSFECATFLTSLLLGQGYNAFVVSGYASREKIRCDRTRINCPYLPESKETVLEEKRVDDTTYRLVPPADLRSKFLLKMEAREKSKLEAEIQRQNEERLRAIMEAEKPPPDNYHGHRIHAWVVILPSTIVQTGAKEDVTNPFFIEPSTGETYDLQDGRTNLLYLGVESIWNDENYWVNMQRDLESGCDQINWTLTVTELWEHLLPGEPWTMRGVEDDVVEEDVRIDRERHLDMPFSYVNEIYIDSLDFERRYPQGRKTIFYKKVKVDLYAPYTRLDGSVEIITIYDDYDYIVPIEVYLKYANRSDCLERSQKILNTGYVIDYYKRSRNDACKEHRYFAHDHDAVDSERTLCFYDMVRLDGLSQIRMYPYRLTQYYVDREDLLYYRDVEFSTDKGDPVVEGIHYRHILRIIEKYRRNERVPASKDIAVREFALAENEIRLKFHYEEERITRATRTYAKPEVGENLDIHKTVIQSYNPDATSQPEQSLYLFYELEKLLEEEDQCISNVRDAETEVSSFIKTRASEYPSPNLTISSFDRNRIAETGTSIKDSISVSPSQRDISKTVDYLAPYMAQIGNPKHMSKAQAYLLRDDCLSDFKQLQVNKANLILRKIEKLTDELNKIQSLLTQNEDLTREQEEEILAKSNEINFNLHLFEMKLNHHKDLAPIRYKMLIEFLQEDERLAVLYK